MVLGVAVLLNIPILTRRIGNPSEPEFDPEPMNRGGKNTARVNRAAHYTCKGLKLFEVVLLRAEGVDHHQGVSAVHLIGFIEG